MRPPPNDRTHTTHDRVPHCGSDLKAEVKAQLEADYYSPIIQKIRHNGHHWEVGGLHLRLATAFGFCYGVDKAIDFAYETVRRYPDRRIFLTNEIIHNPRVNRRLVEMGIHILSQIDQQNDQQGQTLEEIGPEDVVILPAFGIESDLLGRLRRIGCSLVDTTCGSVKQVWKRVERYARDGFTAVIHGKWSHEETIATCSHVSCIEGGHYLVVRDRDQAHRIGDFIRTGKGAGRLAQQFRNATSEGFDFNRHLERVGVANQTTMLSSESLDIAQMMRQAMIDRWGEEHLDEHYRSFDTICNATQQRQDAVMELMESPPTLMLVVGGFNSSNTGHLCEIAAQYCPTYHVDDADCLLSPDEIRHRPPGVGQATRTEREWLPRRRPLEIGLTAGASTPNRVVGEVIERLIAWEEAATLGG